MGSLKKSPLFTFCAGKEIISKGKILYSSPRTWLWHSFDMKVNIFHQGDRNWRTQLQGEKLRKRQEAPFVSLSSKQPWLIPNEGLWGQRYNPGFCSAYPKRRVCACSWEGHLYRPASASLSECHAKHAPFRFRVQIILWKGVVFSF